MKWSRLAGRFQAEGDRCGRAAAALTALGHEDSRIIITSIILVVDL